MDPDSIPAICGFPVALEALGGDGRVVRYAVVRDLESQLDRDRLLGDKDYIPPYWALVWSGARLFAERLLARTDLRDRTVLDVGCGVGVVSLAAATLGAHVTAVDRASEAIEFLHLSEKINGLPIETLVGDVRSVVSGRRFDLVVAAEILYERSEFSSLADALVRCLGPAGKLVVVDAHRVDTEEFYGHLEELGMVACSSERLQVAEEGTLVTIDVAEFAPPAD